MDREDRVRQLVDDFQNGYLTRRGFLVKAAAFGLTAATAVGLLGVPRMQRRAVAQNSVQPKQWEQGKGWGWVWGMTTSSATSTS
jgi:cytochrome P450